MQIKETEIQFFRDNSSHLEMQFETRFEDFEMKSNNFGDFSIDFEISIMLTSPMNMAKLFLPKFSNIFETVYCRILTVKFNRNFRSR